MAAYVAALQRIYGSGQGDRLAASAKDAILIRQLWAHLRLSPRVARTAGYEVPRDISLHRSERFQWRGGTSTMSSVLSSRQACQSGVFQ